MRENAKKGILNEAIRWRRTKIWVKIRSEALAFVLASPSKDKWFFPVCDTLTTYVSNSRRSSPPCNLLKQTEIWSGRFCSHFWVLEVTFLARSPSPGALPAFDGLHFEVLLWSFPSALYGPDTCPDVSPSTWWPKSNPSIREITDLEPPGSVEQAEVRTRSHQLEETNLKTKSWGDRCRHLAASRKRPEGKPQVPGLQFIPSYLFVCFLSGMYTSG